MHIKRPLIVLAILLTISGLLFIFFLTTGKEESPKASSEEILYDIVHSRGVENTRTVEYLDYAIVVGSKQQDIKVLAVDLNTGKLAAEKTSPIQKISPGEFYIGSNFLNYDGTLHVGVYLDDYGKLEVTPAYLAVIWSDKVYTTSSIPYNSNVCVKILACPSNQNMNDIKTITVRLMAENGTVIYETDLEFRKEKENSNVEPH